MISRKATIVRKRSAKKDPLKNVLSTTIGFENYADYYDLFLCDDQKTFLQTITKWLRANSDEKDELEGMILDARAMFVSISQKRLKQGRRKVGALFFIRGNELTHGVVAHECLHAALEHMSALCGYRGSYSDDYLFNNSPEEQLCGKVQELVNGCYRFFKEHGVRLQLENSIYRDD